MGKTRSSITTRSKPKDYTQHCKCSFHDVYYSLDENKEGFRTYSRTSHDYNKDHLKWLEDNGKFSKRCNRVCSSCLKYAAERLKCEGANFVENNDVVLDGESQSEPILVETPISEPVQKVLDLLEADELTEKEELKLLEALGKKINPKIYDDTVQLRGRYKEVKNTNSKSCMDFLRNTEGSLLSFLIAVTGINLNDPDSKKLYALCLTIETIYFIRNLMFVGPFSFCQSIVKWSFSGSKAAHTLDGATTASGCITTLRNWMRDAAARSPNVCPKGDIDAFADNTQRKSKTTRVKNNGTTPIGIATNVVFIQSDSSSTLQEKSALSPDYWFDYARTYNLEIGMVEDHLNRKFFRPYRNKKQQRLIEKIQNEIKDGQDHVDLVNECNEEQIVCMKCRFINPKANRICSKCEFNFVNFPSREELYGDVPDGHPKDKPLIKLGEVIGENPNSFESITNVMKDLVKQCNVGEDRKWLRLGFDGVPYRMASEIIENYTVCDQCGAEFEDETKFLEHVPKMHATSKESPHHRYFKDILLAVGAGHMEKNLLLAIFRLCREIHLVQLADSLGFKSKNAKDFIVNCGDHHLSWQILEIMYQAFSSELIHAYLKCNSGEPVSVAHFVQWKNTKVKNANYHFYYDLVFNVLLGMKCFRSGVRRNNSDYMLAGRQKVAPLMFNGKHDIYQPLIAKDMALRCAAPKEIVEYMAKNEAFDRSGEHFRGEGGDYVTETENKHLKSHLSPGVPTLDNWIMASRNHDIFQSTREAVYSKSGLKNPGSEESSIFKFEKEIQKFRSVIRNAGLFEDPCELMTLKSIDGVELHHDLVNFYFQSKESYDAYKVNSTDFEIVPIFVTYDEEREFNDISNWTINKIKEQTEKLVEMLPNKDSVESFKRTIKLNKRSKKSCLVTIYDSIKLQLETQKAQLIEITDKDLDIDFAVENSEVKGTDLDESVVV